MELVNHVGYVLVGVAVGVGVRVGVLVWVGVGVGLTNASISSLEQ